MPSVGMARPRSRRCTVVGVALAAVSLPWASARAEAPPACFGRVATIVGTRGNDRLAGTSGSDVIVGLGGTDFVSGRGGDDWICLESDGALADTPHRETFLVGGGGADHIRGGPYDDSLVGGRGDDVLHGDHSGGDNELSGDFMAGGTGDDVLFGGEDGDFARGGWGRDLLYLGPGRDVGIGHRGDDVVHGGPGGDGLGGVLGFDHVDGVDHPFMRGLGEPGADSFFGEKGDDWFGLGRGRDEMRGGAGSDGIVLRTKWASSFEADLPAGSAVGGGSATDALTSVQHVHAHGVADVKVVGNARDNHLVARSSSAQATVTIEGRGGDDRIEIASRLSRPATGTARLFGNGGDDRMWAGCDEGTDHLDGGRGNDVLTACDGPEELFGGPGDDVLQGSADDSPDVFDGGEGRDLISYRSSNAPASVDLGAGRASSCASLACDASVLVDVEDAMGTRAGDDLTGDDGDNHLYGAGGNDVLSGRGGDDRLFGETGDDLLDGGEGVNSNDGGEGADTCLDPSSAEGAIACEAPP